MSAIQEIVEHAAKIKNGEHDKVQPGQPLRFSEACTVNDRIWQGDLALTISNKVPEGYVKPKKEILQLVPGENVGARHVLDSLVIPLEVFSLRNCACVSLDLVHRCDAQESPEPHS